MTSSGTMDEQARALTDVRLFQAPGGPPGTEKQTKKKPKGKTVSNHAPRATPQLVVIDEDELTPPAATAAAAAPPAAAAAAAPAADAAAPPEAATADGRRRRAPRQ